MHKSYGRVKVAKDALETGGDFVEVTLLNKRDGLPSKITVGKAALEDKGNYQPKQRALASRVEKYLRLVPQYVKMFMRDGHEWEELYSVGCLGLVVADSRYNQESPVNFAVYAKKYIAGYIMDHVNPTKNGDMNIVKGVWDEAVATYAPEVEIPEHMELLAKMLPEFTIKERTIMVGLYIYGYTERSMAKQLGCDQRTIRWYKDKAVKKMKGKL